MICHCHLCWQVLLFQNSDIDIGVAFGVGENLMWAYYHINYICHLLGENKCLVLAVLHSFIDHVDSDNTSAFFGKI